ncbi:MAG: FxsA family protein [Rhodobacteraceae bacterium]|nr:FxsA family protein [Paracoccaceae bacterium]
MWLFALFVMVPMIEIALFIKVGGLIGLWPTLGIVIVTAIAGSYLVRVQGLAVLGRLRETLQDMSDPSEPIAHGALILVSGVLLLTPGFFTDTVGLLLLVPGLRAALIRRIAARVTVDRFGAEPPRGRREPHRPDVIDGDFIEIDPDGPAPGGNSGWTRH